MIKCRKCGQLVPRKDLTPVAVTYLPGGGITTAYECAGGCK